MRCHPLRWLWGLLPLAVWTWITVLSERPRIEADLTQRTDKALEAAGLGWANVNFAGRDGILGGKANDDNEPAEALRVASGVWGVRGLEAQTELIRRVDTYLWSAARRDNGSIRLTGYMPSLKAKKQIEDAVRAQFPKAEIEDRMELARGAPPLDQWIGGIKYGLKQLAGLKRGHIDLTGTDLSITGEAETVPTYQGIKTALKSLPNGLKLTSEKITPPVVHPYTWNAQASNGQVVLTGHVPSEKSRDEILAHAKPLFGKVIDQMQLAEGAPEGFSRATRGAVTELARLKEGTSELKDLNLALSGEAADESTANSVRAALKSAVPGGFKLVEKLKFPIAVAPPPPPPVDTAAEERERQAAAERDRARKQAEEAELKRLAEARERTAEAERERARKQAEEAEAKRKADEARRETEERERAAAARKAEAQRCQQSLRDIAKSGIIRCERAKAELKSESRDTLDKLAKAANACPGYAIEVEGHTDAEGTPERNKALSERRANAVVGYLSDAGVSSSRLKAVGHGETQPVAANDTPENRAKNRRIEFVVKAD